MQHRYANISSLQDYLSEFILKEAIPSGGTVAPVIIASDKTRLTQFSGNKSAYPVYLTI